MREKGEKFHEFSPLKKFPICGRLSFWSKGDDVILLFSELLEGKEIRLFLGINKKAALCRGVRKTVNPPYGHNHREDFHMMHWRVNAKAPLCKGSCQRS